MILGLDPDALTSVRPSEGSGNRPINGGPDWKRAPTDANVTTISSDSAPDRVERAPQSVGVMDVGRPFGVARHVGEVGPVDPGRSQVGDPRVAEVVRGRVKPAVSSCDAVRCVGLVKRGLPDLSVPVAVAP